MFKNPQKEVYHPKHAKGLRSFKIVKNVILTIVLVVLLSVLFFTLIARINGKTPTFFGHTVYRVSSASMVPYLKVGDIILCRECDPMTLKAGDVITYDGESGELAGRRVTHRVVKEPYLDPSDEAYYLVTKGDDNPAEDTPIKTSQVTGIMVGKLELLKMLYDFFLTPGGLLVILLLIILAFLNEIINLGRAIFGKRS